MNKTDRMIKTLNSRPEIKTPIATDFFLPNHSGIDTRFIEADNLYVTTKLGVGKHTDSTTADFEVFKQSPTANQIIARFGTSDDTTRLSIDEDGDVVMDGNLNAANGDFSSYCNVNSGILTQKRNNITTSKYEGIYTQNTYSSTAVSPVQVSPLLGWKGTAWDTGSAKTAQFCFWSQLTPVSGNPAKSRLDIFHQEADAGTYGDPTISILYDGTTSGECNGGIDITAPTARLHLPACTTSAGTAPMKITAGSLLSSTEAGAIESDGTHLYWTDSGGTRRQLD